MKRLLICGSILLCSAVAGAQTPPAPTAGTVNVQVDPIRCWWRTSAGSVRIGEQFDLALTCAVLENEAVQVVPDESRLGIAVVQVSPFEVVSGSHPADLRSGSRRFFQYQYRLRIITPDAIGKDVAIPGLILHYRVNSKVAANAAVQGRDLVYVLPPEPIRVDALVPADAPDIRDAAGENFANVDSLGFRASVLEIVAMSAVAFGVLMTLLVLVGLARRATRRTPADERQLSTGHIVGFAGRELSAVRREREQLGWTDGLRDRAAAATRIAAACALGRGASQRLSDGTAVTGEGRLVVPGPLRGKPRILSSPVTPTDLARELARPGALHHAALEEFRDAIDAFSTAQYGRTAALDDTALDGALAGAISATAKVRADHTWIKTFLRQLRAGGAPAQSQA